MRRRDFIARIRALSPRARIVFLSGQMVEPQVAALADAVVQKPVTGPSLIDAIHRVLQDAVADQPRDRDALI